jgi:hypothetical protein
LPEAQERFLDPAAPAIMVWTLIDFGYGDIGAGPTSVLLAIVLGLVGRRSVIVPRAADSGGPARPTDIDRAAVEAKRAAVKAGTP